MGGAGESLARRQESAVDFSLPRSTSRAPLDQLSFGRDSLRSRRWELPASSRTPRPHDRLCRHGSAVETPGSRERSPHVANSPGRWRHRRPAPRTSGPKKSASASRQSLPQRAVVESGRSPCARTCRRSLTFSVQFRPTAFHQPACEVLSFPPFGGVGSLSHGWASASRSATERDGTERNWSCAGTCVDSVSEGIRDGTKI